MQKQYIDFYAPYMFLHIHVSFMQINLKKIAFFTNKFFLGKGGEGRLQHISIFISWNQDFFIDWIKEIHFSLCDIKVRLNLPVLGHLGFPKLTESQNKEKIFKYWFVEILIQI